MSSNIKVLIVDDHEDNRIVLSSSIKKIEGVSIAEAKNGLEAIEAVESSKPDLILMDVLMPVMDGIEATKRVKESYPDIVILIITALDDIDVEENLLSIGANAYIKKPIDRKIVKYKVKNFIELIKRRRSEQHAVVDRSAINIFTKEIRCFKTHFVIRDEENVMDFGSWLIDLFVRYHKGVTFKFDSKLEILYKTLYTLVETHGVATVIIEEDFENLYLTIAGALRQDIDEYLLEDTIYQNNTLYFRIKLLEKSISVAQEEHKSKISGADKEEGESLQEGGTKRRSIEVHEKHILQKSCHDEDEEIMSAAEFMQNLGEDIPDEVHDIRELLDEWEVAILDLEFEFNAQNILHVSDMTLKISSVINKLYEFMTLGYAISSLAMYIKDIEIDTLDDAKKRMFIMLLKHIRGDIHSWWQEIFINQQAKNIHYLDSSLYSSCMQIEALFDEKEIDNDDDFELF